jgi:hypothetical protein
MVPNLEPGGAFVTSTSLTNDLSNRKILPGWCLIDGAAAPVGPATPARRASGVFLEGAAAPKIYIRPERPQNREKKTVFHTTPLRFPES